MSGWLRNRRRTETNWFRRDIQDYILAKYVEARWVGEADRGALLALQ